MTFYIVLAVGLIFVHIALQALTATSERGLAWNAGPRDEERKAEGVLAGRAERALRNYLETFAAFGVLALLLIVTGRADGLGLTGAVVYVLARTVYIPLYLLGIPYLRSLVWIAAAIGLTLMAYRVLV